MIDLKLYITDLLDKRTPKNEIKNTIMSEYVVDNLKDKLKKIIKIGILINEPPAPNNPNNIPEKINNIKPKKYSINKYYF